MENWIDYELLQIKNKCLDLVRKNSEDFGKRNVLYSSGHIQLTNKELNEYLKDEIKSLIKEYNLKNKKINELEEYLYKWIIDLEKEIKNVYVKKGFSMSLIEWLKLNDDDKIKNIFDKYRQIWKAESRKNTRQIFFGSLGSIGIAFVAGLLVFFCIKLFSRW